MQLNDGHTLILVKARPHASQTYSETVCCAGVDENGDWARLFPVPYRRLNKDQKFSRWDWIDYQWVTPRNDKRRESRHVQEDTIVCSGKLPTKDKTPFVNSLIDPDLETATQCDKSLTLCRPSYADFTISRKSQEQFDQETRAYETAAKQGTLFGNELDPIQPCEFSFRYKWVDSKGVPHSHECADWETDATFFRFKKMYGEEKALTQITHIFGEKYPSEGMVFALGTHSKRPKQWLLVGVLRLDETLQPSLI